MLRHNMVDPLGRRVKDALLTPIARLVPNRLSPNSVTLLSLPPGLATAILAAYGIWTWAIVAFALNRILDGLDGLLARSRSLQSDFGGYLDIMIDFLVYALIPIGVWLGIEVTLGMAAGAGAAVAAVAEARSLLLNALPLILLLAVFYVNAASWMYLSSVLEKRRAGTPTPGTVSAADTATGNTASSGDRARRQTAVEMPTGLVEGTETVIFYFLFLLIPQQYAVLFYLMAAATSIGVLQRLIWAMRRLG